MPNRPEMQGGTEQTVALEPGRLRHLSLQSASIQLSRDFKAHHLGHKARNPPQNLEDFPETKQP